MKFCITPRISGMQNGLFVASALGLSVLGGCKVGPDYRGPATVALSEDWSMIDRPQLQGEPANLGAWWQHFNDPVLESLIHTAVAQNLSLKEAGQRVLEARALRGVVAGNLFPQQQSLNGAYNATRISSNVANFVQVPGFFQPNLFPDNWAAGFSAAWELDFWGRYRRAIETADAELAATVDANDEVLVILLGDLATQYIEMRTLERRLELARQNVEIQRGTLELNRKKKEAGVASGIDLAQAEANLAQTEAILPLLEIQRRQAGHRICLLLGRPASDLGPELQGTSGIPRPPQGLAFDIPADLLRRRPDVARAERQLAAQAGRIGVAKSEFYPHLSLAGTIGFQSRNLSNLLETASFTGSVGPQFQWNILNYGRIKNRVRAEEAAFERLGYSYQNAVLNAHRESEDAQVAYVLGFTREEALQRAVKSTYDAVEMSKAAYEAGSIDFNRVYLLQSELVRQQDELAAIEGQIAASLVAIFRAAGGGWEARPCDGDDWATAAGSQPVFVADNYTSDFMPGSFPAESLPSSDPGNLESAVSSPAMQLPANVAGQASAGPGHAVNGAAPASMAEVYQSEFTEGNYSTLPASFGAGFLNLRSSDLEGEQLQPPN